jgi:hypothetical protein
MVTNTWVTFSMVCINLVVALCWMKLQLGFTSWVHHPLHAHSQRPFSFHKPYHTTSEYPNMQCYYWLIMLVQSFFVAESYLAPYINFYGSTKDAGKGCIHKTQSGRTLPRTLRKRELHALGCPFFNCHGCQFDVDLHIFNYGNGLY